MAVADSKSFPVFLFLTIVHLDLSSVQCDIHGVSRTSSHSYNGPSNTRTTFSSDPNLTSYIRNKLHNIQGTNTGRGSSISDNIEPMRSGQPTPHSLADGITTHDQPHTNHDHHHFSTGQPEAKDSLQIERFDETVLMNPTDSSSHDSPAGRHGKKDDEYEICNLCLCDNNRTGFSCQARFSQNNDQQLVLEASSIPLTAEYIMISGYSVVQIKKDTFSSPALNLRYLKFEDIGSLQMEEHSLHFSQRSKGNIEVQLKFKNCNFPSLETYTLTQLAHTEHDEDTNILAPEDTRYITLELYRCTIGEIKPKALYLARMLYVNITDTTIKSVSPHSIDLSVYQEWVLQDSNLPTLPPRAVCIHAKKSVIITRNYIETIQPNAWFIESAGQVLFDYNTVGLIQGYAFQNITPDASSWVASIVFVNNSVQMAEPNSLVTSDRYPRHERKVLDNRFDVPCECNISSVFEGFLDVRTGVSSDVMMHRAVLMNSLCQVVPGDTLQYQHINRYLRSECQEIPLFRILTGALIAVVVVVCVTIAAVCARKAKKAQDEVSYLGECSSRSFSTLNTHAAPLSPSGGGQDNKNVFFDSAGNPSWIVAVPEVKTYQETEVHVTYEESHPIRSSVRNSNLLPAQCKHVQEMESKALNTRQSCPFN